MASKTVQIVKVSFIIGETINLPISFIIGISFIGGSITASSLAINFKKDNEYLQLLIDHRYYPEHLESRIGATILNISELGTL